MPNDEEIKYLMNYYIDSLNQGVSLAILQKIDHFISLMKKETLNDALNRQMLVFSQFYWRSWDKQVFNIYTHQHDELIDFLRNGKKEEAVKDLIKDIDSFMKK